MHRILVSVVGMLAVARLPTFHTGADDAAMTLSDSVPESFWIDTDGQRHEGIAGETLEEQAATLRLMDQARRDVSALGTPVTDPEETAARFGIPAYFDTEHGRAWLVAVGDKDASPYNVYRTLGGGD